jgi:alpha-L-fucosidase
MTDISRRQFAGVAIATIATIAAGRRALGRSLTRVQARRPVPTASQLAWQRGELAMFLHFGVNTFSDREWGDGKEDPSIFAPSALDARQWAHTAKAAGFRMMILTAKHHDGFCLWPSATTTHTVAASSFRNGHGDVVREFVDACRAERLDVGVYCSPWDRNSPVYGDSPRYNDFFCDQLTELLTRYGPIAEVWFDGANGEGPDGRKQMYDWPRFQGLVRRLQPNAVMFSDAGPDVRWIGNERGVAGDTNWSTINPDAVPYPGADGPGIVAALQNGDPDGTVWRPGETDVSIRPGWFHHPAEDAKVKSPENLLDLYFTSVGRNSKLLLNVPPTRAGLLHETDIASLTGMRRSLDALFANRVANARLACQKSGPCAIDLSRDQSISIVELSEDITKGQTVARHHVSLPNGTVLASGTTIGYKRLHRVSPTIARRVVVDVEPRSADVHLRLY